MQLKAQPQLPTPLGPSIIIIINIFARHGQFNVYSSIACCRLLDRLLLPHWTVLLTESNSEVSDGSE